MTYVANNDIVLAAAIAGITAGVNAGKDAAQISAMSLEESANLTAAILSAAQEVDQAIPFVPKLSVSGSNPTLLVTPFNGSGAANDILPIFTFYQTIFGLCKVAFEGKGDVASVVNAVYSQTAQGIYAQALVTIGQQPSS